MNIELREPRLAITSFLSATAILVFALTLRMAGAQLSWDGQDYAQLQIRRNACSLQQRTQWGRVFLGPGALNRAIVCFVGG